MEKNRDMMYLKRLDEYNNKQESRKSLVKKYEVEVDFFKEFLRTRKSTPPILAWAKAEKMKAMKLLNQVNLELVNEPKPQKKDMIV